MLGAMPLNLPIRPRRLRGSHAVRSLANETRLSPDHLVLPLFVHDRPSPSEIPSMPGVVRHALPTLLRECERAADAGIRAVALFPCIDPSLKDPAGTAAFDENGLIARTVRAVKGAVPSLAVVADVALDPFTSHGHDGLLEPGGADVANDETVEALARLAILYAAAGADIVAPSDMMDGRIGAIRGALDHAGFQKTAILAYSAKFASAYYGPFREAVGSQSSAAPVSKATYQIAPGNLREALREAALDEAEGADFVMVKPAGPCLDVIRAVREQARVPVAAYQVSGEFAHIHAAAAAGWTDYRATRDEALTAIRRAGADIILSYFAREVAEEITGRRTVA
jgi:porphobilinogen synthase